MSSSNNPLPVHSLSLLEFPVHVRRIEYNNPYDFTREHRHTYFEIFFFEKGGGNQLIDFREIPVLESSCYIVFPQQIHLLRRGAQACGILVQFKEEVLSSPQVRILLQKRSFSENPAVLFENNPEEIKKNEIILSLLKGSLEKHSDLSNEISLNYLQALLLQLLDNFNTGVSSALSEDHKVLFNFQYLLEEQFLQNHLVSKYSAQLGVTEKKLTAITKKYMGLTSIQVIHERLVLEAKRLLLFNNSSQKEIAFHLGFDSHASFSQFIKNKTGFSPSELSSKLVDIHK